MRGGIELVISRGGGKVKSVDIPSHVTLRVKRPNGTIESIIHPKFTEISPSTFKQMQEATKKAGKGELLSYENVKKSVNVEHIRPTQGDIDREKYDADQRRQYYQKIDRSFYNN